MESVINYQDIVDETIKLLKENDWKKSYSKYLSNWATYTKKSTNYNKVKNLIRNCYYKTNNELSEGSYFEQNFGLYTSVSIKKQTYNLRFRGLSIAFFYYDEEGKLVFDKSSIKKQKKGSNQIPEMIKLLGKERSNEWATGEKSISINRLNELCSMFSPKNISLNYYNEAVVESALLNHINSHQKDHSPFSNITAITRPKKKTAYFQLNTPLSCSDIHNYYTQKNKSLCEFIKYSGPSYGGGIDILCRRGRGGSSIVQVIEVKDSYVNNEQPQYAISQAIAYSTFLLRLLRSKEVKCKEDKTLTWWNIIVGQRRIEKPLKIEAVIAMPPNPDGKTMLDFIGKELTVPWENGNNNDIIRLTYLPFTQGNVEENSFNFEYIRG